MTQYNTYTCRSPICGNLAITPEQWHDIYETEQVTEALKNRYPVMAYCMDCIRARNYESVSEL
jgi:hypothetical protein